MHCFLRTNSEEVRDRIKNSDIDVCSCCSFTDAEWLYGSHNSVHGIFPAKEGDWDAKYFGTKENFKEMFLTNNPDCVDCGEDVELFIKTIHGESQGRQSQAEIVTQLS